MDDANTGEKFPSGPSWVEVAIIPVVLGAGIQFLPPPGTRAQPKLTKQRCTRPAAARTASLDAR